MYVKAVTVYVKAVTVYVKAVTVYVKAVTVLYLIQIHSPKIKLYTFGFTIHEEKTPVPPNAGSKMQ